MSNVTEFPRLQGSVLCHIQLVRRPDGEVGAVLQDMAGNLIETTGGDVAERVSIIAGWLKQGAADMERQAAEWAKWLGDRA
ncbi:hypothetical protein [Sphingobium sp. DC-2]|uniref:hypothetical protein n=1 Tax=Sphingobium sp. DC-2 TaxID=1303256 RepID=UPI0004C2B580|nr:hypothetical protein [Sphingobium sp. DC-2]